MMNVVKTLICSLLLAVASAGAYAGPYTDRMGECLVLKTTGQDRVDLITWVFSAMAVHPSLNGATHFSTQQMQSHDQNMANLLMRLVTVDCKNEVQAAIREEGESALETSFSVLGMAAMGDVMRDPKVNQRLQSFTQYLDEKKLRELF